MTNIPHQVNVNNISVTNNINTKNKIIYRLLGVQAEAVRDVIKSNTLPIPCIYLFTLGTIKQLRKSMNIDKVFTDDMIICKYGMTDNLMRRTYEHICDFSKIESAKLRLKYYSCIDPQYISKAETDIKHYFEDINAIFNYDNYVELVVLTPKQINDRVKKQYIGIQKNYFGYSKELIIKIDKLQNDNKLTIKGYKNKILQKDNILLQKNNELLLKNNELLLKDTELLLKNNDNQILQIKLFETKLD
jgi:hypothetical protein